MTRQTEYLVVHITDGGSRIIGGQPVKAKKHYPDEAVEAAFEKESNIEQYEDAGTVRVYEISNEFKFSYEVGEDGAKII